MALAGRLLADGVELAVMEATSDYWRIWLRREASCCIPGLAGRNLEDIPGSMAYLASKGKGDRSMPLKRRPGPGIRDGVPQDPRNMVKAKLPEP